MRLNISCEYINRRFKMKLRSALLLVVAATVCALSGLLTPQVASASVDIVTNFPKMPPIVSDGAKSPVTGTFNVGLGVSRLLVVAVATEYSAAQAPTFTVTYGGQSLNSGNGGVILNNTTGNNKLWIGYLNEAGIVAAGANKTISVTPSVTTNLVATYVTAAVFVGVDQTTPLTGSGSLGTTATALTIGPVAFTPSVASKAGNNGMSVYLVNWNNNLQGETTAPSGFTQIRNYLGSNLALAGGVKVTTGAVAESISSTTTTTSSIAALGAFGLNPAILKSAPLISTCGDCHGNPPNDGTARNVPPGQYPGAHDKHSGGNANQYAFVCTECHYNAVGYNHSTGFKNISGTRVPRNTYGGTTNIAATNAPVYTQTCTKSTCHSSGRSNIQYSASPTWNSTSTCQSCHGGRNSGGTYVKSASGFSMSTTHGQHLGKYTSTEINCQMCHGKTAQNHTALKNYTGSKYHANGSKTVYFTDITYGSYTSYKTSGGNVGKCTNTACHGGISRSAWTNQGAVNTTNTCTHCHGQPQAANILPANTDRKNYAPGWVNGGNTGTSTDQLTADTDPRVGAHFAHLSSVYMPKIKCNECHRVPSTPFGETTHMTGTRYNSQSITFAQASTAIKNGLAGFTSYTSGTGTKAATCSTVYCHGAKMPKADTGGTGRKPSWNQNTLIARTPDTTTCNRCHGLPPRFGNTSVTHRSVTTNDFVACSTCHGSVVNSTGQVINKSLHINGNIDASGSHAFPYYGSTHAADASPITTCTGCHTNGSNTTYPVSAGVKPDCRACHTKGTPGTGCNSCHGSGATQATAYPNSSAFPNWSGTHTKHVVNLSLACSECHDTKGGGIGDATHGSGNRIAHNTRAGFVNVTSTTAKFRFDRFTLGTFKGTCTNVSCHGGIQAEWGVTKLNCVTCHANAIGSRVAISGEFASQSHHVQGAELPLTPVHCAKCHWEANADGSVNSTYHQGIQNANAGISLIVWTGTTRPASPTSSTLVAYTANGARNQISKLNAVCLGCHSVYNATTKPFGTYQTNAYAPEQRLKGHTVADNSSIQARYSTTRTVPWSNYLFNNNSGQVAQYGTNQKNKVTKALSAHGSASKNQMPAWSAAADGPGEDRTMSDYTYTGTSGKRNVFCYDCHNSHGSNATGITSSYSSATGGRSPQTYVGGKGGLLKTTVANKRGYSVTYTPAQRSITYSNVSGIGQATRTTTVAVFNPGAAICNDCHNNDTSKVNITRPWSITGTFSSSRAIVGYWSTPYFDNYTVYSAKRTVYKAGGTVGAINDRRKPMGGHFGSSVSTRSAQHDSDISGLCTPCHDPHGVTPLLAADRDHGVPLLKGTWVTSPYLEDKAGKLVKRGGGSKFAGIGSGGAAPGYHIDQNTFLTAASAAYVINGGATGPATSATARGNKRSQHFRAFNVLSSAKTATGYPGSTGSGSLTAAQFAGLCNECHTQANLTNTATPAASNWQSKERVHQSVLGWAATTGSNANNQLHAYTCAKCHAPHVSRLPRLLVTNCLDQKHFGQSVSSSIASTGAGTTTPGNIIQSTLTSSALGAGRFPGGGSRYSNTPTSAQNSGGWWFQTNGAAAGSGTQPTVASYGSLCHNSTTAGGSTTYSPVQQKWNKKSQW